MTAINAYRIAACAALAIAAAGCGAGGSSSSAHHAVAAATPAAATRAAVTRKAPAKPVPAYVARLKADGYTPSGSCALHGGEGVGQVWGNDSLGNGEMLVETKTADDAATFAAALNAFAAAAASSASSPLTVATAGNYVVMTGPAAEIDRLGKAGC